MICDECKQETSALSRTINDTWICDDCSAAWEEEERRFDALIREQDES